MMASEKAAAQYQLEKEASRLREVQVRLSALTNLPFKIIQPFFLGCAWTGTFIHR